MYTIGQFSRICRTTTKALRHYEKMGIIGPARVERYNQYRYYTQEQVATVRNILHLKGLGIPLKEIKRILEKNPGVEEMRVFLEEHRRLLVEQLALYNDRLVKLACWEKALEANEMTEPGKYDVQVKDLPEVQVRSERRALKKIHQELPIMFQQLLEEIESKGGTCSGAPISLFYDDEFDPHNIDLEVAWPVIDNNLANRVLPATRGASVIYVGPYNECELAYQAVFDWINRNGYRALSPMRLIYYNDCQVTPPQKLVTEVFIPFETI